MKIGCYKQDITCFIPGIGMMGYGQHHNTVQEIATPLWGRVLILEENHKRFILVHLEQAFVTLAIKEEVLRRLDLKFPKWKISEAELVITAQHTHSAPGGYSHYPFFNITIPGFQIPVFEKIVSSILIAIEEASKNMEDVTASWGTVNIDDSKEIAFNRSMKAFRLNPESTYEKEEEKHLAVDRSMTGLMLKNSSGKTKAFLNWFGVHCTSISSFNQRIHHDNKGMAAALFEEHYPGAMAFFLQASAGDVSPNFIWDKSLKRMRGKFKDQYESAAFNGELQFRESEKIEYQISSVSEFDFHHLFLDMGLEVGPPAHGVAFFKGTLEGPGISSGLGMIVSLLSRLVKTTQLLKDPKKNSEFYKTQGRKDILLDHRNGSFLTLPLNAWKYLPPLPEPTLEAFRKTARVGALTTLPWVPTILPFQVLRLGDTVIAFVPGEISTMSGRRLKKMMTENLRPIGVKNIIISSYANAYMGYIVTPEEYDQQCYEGGHCVYGRETLSGIMKGFSYLCDRLQGKKIQAHLPKEPFHFPSEELAKRSVT